MFYTLMAGRAREHNNLGYLTTYGLQKTVEAKIKENIACVKEITIHLDTRIGPLMHVVISIAKESDDQPEQVINEAFNTSMGFFDLSWIANGSLSLTKMWILIIWMMLNGPPGPE